MTERWFYWQRTFGKRWTPVIAASPPGKKADSQAPVTTGLRKLEARHATWTLEDCADEYPVD